jgi:hypothetical protein
MTQGYYVVNFYGMAGSYTVDEVWIAAMLMKRTRTVKAGAVRSSPSAKSRSQEMRSFYVIALQPTSQERKT